MNRALFFFLDLIRWVRYPDAQLVHESETPESRAWYGMYEAIELRQRIRGLDDEQPEPLSGRHRIQSEATWLSKSLEATFFGVFFLGSIVCGVCFAKFAPDGITPAKSDNCGIYFPSPAFNWTGQHYQYMIPINYETESESSKWAHNCYGQIFDERACSMFLNRRVPYETKHNMSCPFEDEMCFYGANTAIGFYTGAVSATVLGINAPTTFEFQRTTECAPLNRNATFVQQVRNGSSSTFRYNYGPNPVFGGITYETRSDGKLDDAASYQVKYV